MTNQIFSSLKVIALAVVLSFGLSYVYAWTAPTATPPTGNVSAPLNTSGIAQTKTGGLTVGELTTTLATKLSNSDIYFTKTDHNHTGIGNTAGNAAIENASNYNTLMILGRANGIGGVRSVSIWDRLDVNGTIKATGGITGNGPTPLTLHYINRNEDSYGAWPGYWQYRYCNGWYNHDTCPGNNVDYPYTCGVSAQTTCVDSYSNNPADTGWCGRYFQDRTVTCNVNEVLSTYDI